MKKLNIHLVSESSGQTVKHVANTALAKFGNLDVRKYHWPLVRGGKALEDVFEKLKRKPGVVLYTLTNEKIRDKLKNFCLEENIPCISAVSKVISEISNYIGTDADKKSPFGNRFNENYFDKVDAMEYSLKHDDGKSFSDLEGADIVLIGPSRTSKTPTSMYLSFNGYKTANIPLISGIELPNELFELKNPLVFGLVINPSRLVEIRTSRIEMLKSEGGIDYTSLDVARKECIELRNICKKNNWKVFDVTVRSIEETSAVIMRSYLEQKKRRI